MLAAGCRLTNTALTCQCLSRMILCTFGSLRYGGGVASWDLQTKQWKPFQPHPNRSEHSRDCFIFFASKCRLHMSLFNVFCCLFSHKMLPFLKNETVQSLFRSKTTGGCFECQYPTAKTASSNLTTSTQQSGVKILVPDFSFYFISVISIYVIPQLSSSCV